MFEREKKPILVNKTHIHTHLVFGVNIIVGAHQLNLAYILLKVNSVFVQKKLQKYPKIILNCPKML